jgi:gas vesicle protein
MSSELGTTNIFLGILAVVSLLQFLLILTAAFLAYRLYNQTMDLLKGIEERQVAPVAAQVSGILNDVKEITSRVSGQAERVNEAVRHTLDRVDETADRVRSSMRSRLWRAVATARGVRAAFEAMFAGNGATTASRASSRTERVGWTGVKQEDSMTYASGYERDRYEEDTGSTAFFMGLLAGTALGAGLGLLFAPKAGSELRQQIAGSAERLQRAAADTYSQASGKVSEAYNQASHRVSDAVQRGRDAVERGREAYEQTRESVGQQPGQSTDPTSRPPYTTGPVTR